MRLARRVLLVAAVAVLARPATGAPTATTVPAVSRAIDAHVEARLWRLGIAPAPVCTDEVFVRRAYLDAIGTLPTAAEVRAFLADPDPARRPALIDRLLARPEFADAWTMRWCDLLRVKSEFPINLWPNAVQAYHRWIRTAVRDGMPLDRFARALLTSSGSNFRVPPVNFYRAVQSKDPPSIARAVALTFLGSRTERWPKDRREGLEALFSRVGYKGTAEWKEEIVFFDASKPGPALAVLPDGDVARLPPDRDPREAFADWLLEPRNPWFARGLANRAWSWLLGRGIVQEPDDLRPDNPPSDPEVLDLLARDLVAGGYDLRHLLRTILVSETYQRACATRSTDPRAVGEFGCYPVRRLEAEVLIDAIDQVTGTTEEYTSRIPEPWSVMPAAQRAIALPDASVSSPFLELFGRSPRDTGLESEPREGPPTAAQALHLLNSSHVRRKIEQGPGLRALSAAAATKPLEAADGIYLTILSRHPTLDEQATILEYLDSAADPKRVGLDLAWALINSTEFQCRH